jgi:cell division protein FtsQ
MASITGYKDVISAMKILSSIKLINPDMFDQLSEINLRDGHDILVQFSNMDYPVIIGRGSEVRKIITFNTLWDYLNGNQVNNLINYVDLRYADHIFLGFSETIASDRG